MKRTKSLLTIAAVIVIGLVGDASAMPSQFQGENCQYFTETDRYVCDEFLEFYQAQGGLEIFGYPLTEAFDDPTLGLRVQYFQRVRMELHPRTSGAYKVLRGSLVDELGYHFAPLPPQQIPLFNNDLHHYFPETDHVVSYAFLDYFREKGGVDTFGYPLSEFMLENGYFVQYFQWARMEWHPEVTSGSQIRLTNLGEIYIERFGVPRGSDELVRVGPATRLHISASVRHIIIGQGDNQTVYVYVTDQRRRPIERATVSMVVHYPANDAGYECESTDESGFTSGKFGIFPAPPGRRVVIDVTVTYNDLTGTTQIFFLPWW